MSHHNHHQHHPHHHYHHNNNAAAAATATTLPRTLAKSSSIGGQQQQPSHMPQPPQYQNPPQPYIDHVYAKKPVLPRGPYLQYKHIQYGGGGDCGGPLQKSTSAVHLPSQQHQQQYQPHNIFHPLPANGAARPENTDNNNHHATRSTQRPQSYHQSGMASGLHSAHLTTIQPYPQHSHPQNAHPPQHNRNAWPENGVQTLGRHRHGRTTTTTAYLQSSHENLLQQQRAPPPVAPQGATLLSQGAVRSGVLTVRRPAPIGAAATSSSSSSSSAASTSSTASSSDSAAAVQQLLPPQAPSQQQHQHPPNFLQQIQTKNAAMAAANRTNYSRSSAAAVDTGCAAAAVNYVRLDEVGHAKPAGLTAADGWAVLCQSVQSLQDLFLADNPSARHVLPLVTPATLQITARGRVVFKLFPIGHHHYYSHSHMQRRHCDDAAVGRPPAAHNNATATSNRPLDTATAASHSQQQRHHQQSAATYAEYLAPEYRANLDHPQQPPQHQQHQMPFTESDIEKMWIHALGITLRRTIATAAPASAAPQQHHQSAAAAAAANHHHTLAQSHWRGAGSPPATAAPVCRRNDQPTTTTTTTKSPPPVASLPSAAAATMLLHGQATAAAAPSAAIHHHHYANPDNSHDYDDECRTDAATSDPANDGRRWQQQQQAAGDGDAAAAAARRQLTSLRALIDGMCAPRAAERASLMGLLNEISEYCRCNRQERPFSHIVMDLYNDVILHRAAQRNIIGSRIMATGGRPKMSNCCTDDSSRSDDTDSGRSSAPGDTHSRHSAERPTYKLPSPPSPPIYATSLKVIRRNNEAAAALRLKQQQHPNPDHHLDKPPATTETKSPVEHVIMRRRRDSAANPAIRRNTIAVTASDMEALMSMMPMHQNQMRQDFARRPQQPRTDSATNAGFGAGISGSKSSECLSDRLVGNNVEKPHHNHRYHELPHTSATLPKLRVRRLQRPASPPSPSSSKPSTNGGLHVLTAGGPEFIRNSSRAPLELDIAGPKCAPEHRRCVNVLLLNGRTHRIACNALQTTAHQIFETVIRAERFAENFFLGLCALIGGDFVFLPAAVRVHKVAPQIWRAPHIGESVMFTLFLRIRFLLPNLRGIGSLQSRHLLYLQLRKSILESQILCDDADLIVLGGLALQAEVGDCLNPTTTTTTAASSASADYFTVSHYLPEGVYQRRRNVAQLLREAHAARRGQHAKDAEQAFVKHVQSLKEYGLHLYSAVWTTDDGHTLDIYAAISLAGIAMFERVSRLDEATADGGQLQPLQQHGRPNPRLMYQRKLYAQFDWLEIENLCYSKRALCVVVRRPAASLKAKDSQRLKYKLKMDGRKSFFAFTLASEHHKFYLKLRNSYTSLKVLSHDMNVSIGQPPLPEPAEPPAPTKATTSAATIAKTASSRVVRTFKKSMLNDNRLLKLRDKFLKRSKSSVGQQDDAKSAQIEQPQPQQSQQHQHRNNKENESPAKETEADDDAPTTPKMSPTTSTGGGAKWISPSRNRVLMGTRAISKTYLNKSLDNIYDSVRGEARKREAQEMRSRLREVAVLRSEMQAGSSSDGGDDDDDVDDEDVDEGLSSSSLSSVGYGRLAKRGVADYERGMAESGGNAVEMDEAEEAYVIHSSIRSLSTAHNTYLAVHRPDDDDFNDDLATVDTITESIFDKINDITGGLNVTLSADRIIRRLRLTKDPVMAAADDDLRPPGLRVHRVPSADRRTRRLFASRSQDSVAVLEAREPSPAMRYTLGISIIQGTDNNVYVKDLSAGGPGCRAGVRVGDQIIAVDGVSLLTLSYGESLRRLQQTGRVVELVLSQIYRPPMEVANEGGRDGTAGRCRRRPTQPDMDYLQRIRYETDVSHVHAETRNEVKEFAAVRGRNGDETEFGMRSYGGMGAAKSLPDLPKVLSSTPIGHATHVRTPDANGAGAAALPRSMALSRRYVGPVRYPVTPVRSSPHAAPTNASVGSVAAVAAVAVAAGDRRPAGAHRLSLLADEDEQQVFI